MKRKVHILLVGTILLLAVRYIYADGFFAVKADEIVRTASIDIRNEETGEWEALGACRITTYCQYCNEPQGHGSASGVYLEPGHAACGWLPIGTIISIEGNTYEIVDICGTEAIDIFIESKEKCACNINTYKNVMKRKEQK